MSIKPVACADNGVLNWYADSKTTEQIDLYVIPDTHRVVSVELLNSIMELAGVALVYQPFGTKDRQNFDALMAIIEDKQ